MAFLESPRFPDAISYGASGGPTFLTDIVTTANGFEYRNQTWAQARRAWDVSHAARRATDAAALSAFFLVACGRTNGFRFKDWTDYAAATGQGIVVASGSKYQIYRRYTSGSTNHDRIITKPVSGKVTITGSGTYALDTTTGLITVSAGTAPTGWTGEYDVPCRFDTDDQAMELIARDGSAFVQGWSSIRIVEVRV